ncbi:hypothetical protein IDSA_02085 [Pseudidiomarina salinarum]|uniref:Uncharacterized protein n=1 Tax=Pseudidiomarina salinarum TaxID=435908 RepID=A0A094JG32_9GAMM|nr:hypothetical protein [Pseudidiomarina salinarum]KFZ31521.1 hypothetical protein IDSA_02085 [Pseudidiomarina salinarum]RUO70713.1 hypothetical protein CWI79_04485 [Pseudidiomarina salinarum]
MSDERTSAITSSLDPEYSLPDIDECMARLELISGLRGKGRIMRWLDLPEGTYSNWKRRNSVNYGKLVGGLLSQGVSLDWFFAPYQNLRYPAPVDVLDLGEIQAFHREQDTMEETIRALVRVEPLLTHYGAPLTEPNKQLMVETFRLQRREVVPLNMVLRQVAKALALRGVPNRGS